jgi:hypothetical protein
VQKSYIRIDGKTDAKQREELRARFQSDDTVKVKRKGWISIGGRECEEMFYPFKCSNLKEQANSLSDHIL